jgi:hypothetical protein
MQALADVALMLARDQQEMHMDKVMACLIELRRVAVERNASVHAVSIYNSALLVMKREQGPSGATGSTGRRIWRRLAQGRELTLISVREAPHAVSGAGGGGELEGEGEGEAEGAVPEAEAQAFYTAPVVAQPAPAAAPAAAARAAADELDLE